MPLIINDTPTPGSGIAGALTGTATIGPRFFSTKFTGNGHTRQGLLSVALRPAAPAGLNASMLGGVTQIPSHEMRAHHTQNTVSTTTIPIAPLSMAVLRAGGFTLAVPDASHRVQIATASLDHTFWFALEPQIATLIEDMTTGPTKKARQFTVVYAMELFVLPRSAPVPDRVPIDEPSQAGWVTLKFSNNPMVTAEAFIEKLLPAAALASWSNRDDLADWLADEDGFNVHDAIARAARIWSSPAMADEMEAYLAHPSSDPADTRHQLRYLANYDVPLEAYRRINDRIEQTFPSPVVALLARENLNLLMSHTLSGQEQIKPTLAHLDPAAVTSTALPSWLSPQQRAAVTSTEPLVMTQAGAGTGKSSVILERIAYLTANGVNPADITVLSFTNAAADHISEKNPAVGSMTIAAMVNDIYTLNHPTHQLSSIDTLCNTLDIFFPVSTRANTLKDLLKDVAHQEPGSTIRLNNYIGDHLDDVMTILDAIGQTSLELEIVINYQQAEHLAEPTHVACRHLIVDEVQDTSVFEFVYLLKHIGLHHQSLFIVGDASQTLYEFRSANPRALNTLEGSGVFATYKLTTNYRSNQEILDFANVTLGGLETNHIAGIQLQADSLMTPTAKSFQEKVTLDHRHTLRVSRFANEELAGVIGETVARDYIEPALTRGEQVAFLARSRREVSIMEEELRARFPDKKLANLTSERASDITLFSQFIKFHWDEIRIVQPSGAAFAVDQGVKKAMTTLVARPTEARILLHQRFLSDWWLRNAATIRGLEAQAMRRTLTYDRFFDLLRDNMLTYEIGVNRAHQNVVSQRNRARKEASAGSRPDLVVSTIHGVKGLEFDNVVVVHKDDSDASQEDRRLFYVALTRAMRSEYILSFSNQVEPAIVSDYKLIVDTLTEHDRARAAAQTGSAGPDPVAVPAA